ncbi:MAG: hypothetical protein V2J55_17025 [Candidatus Competibacteraceae bacterium]|jgi:hypothetical protein|nr:hypothetical protein [Candidatus Competibacteraceae bacterium]
MVTIARFDFLPQAEIARGRLLAEGIDCRLADQHLVQTDWLYSIAIGGIKLQVEPQDAARAQVILNHDYSADLDSETDEST